MKHVNKLVVVINLWGINMIADLEMLKGNRLSDSVSYTNTAGNIYFFCLS